MATRHTIECFIQRVDCMFDQIEFERKYPQYCRSCMGWGGFSYNGSLYEPPGWDECMTCSGRFECPRCGELWSESDQDQEEPCANCGWWYQQPEGMPEPPECPFTYGELCEHSEPF